MPGSSSAVEGRPRESVRDTLESITIALILAFVFRAFVVEAFVIPTGSMAPTLYGAHGTIVCEDCGTEFAYGLQDLKDQRKTVPIRASDKAYCPNCGHPNSNLKIHDERRNPESGDRILVLKWPFHLSSDLLGPARWDVVVFKDPADGVTNFIKRLVGLPNEVLMIVDGDVYTVPMSELSEAALGELDRLRREKHELRAGRTHGTLRKVPRFVLDELNTKMRIVRKTAVAQKALWIPVYDHDHPPSTTEKSRPHWVPKRHDLSGWDASNRRIRFKDRGVEEDCIELGGLPIRANCSYNIRRASPHHQFTPRAEPPVVSDQRVRFVLTPLGTTGSVGVSLTKLARVFRATIHVDGTLHIEEVDDASGAAKPAMLSTRRPPFVPGESVEISFENVDYRLVLRVDGEELLATTDDPESEGYYGPNLKSLRRLPQAQYISRPRIYAEGGRFDLTHLVVARDVHYYQDRRSSLPPPWRTHAPSWGSPSSPILLRGHEYFMLGDNPAASKDSRLWDKMGPHLVERGEACQLGTVPADQLVGKAFFVYWPSMQRIKWLEWLPLFRRWGVVPDVGRMRWIR